MSDNSKKGLVDRWGLAQAIRTQVGRDTLDAVALSTREIWGMGAAELIIGAKHMLSQEHTHWTRASRVVYTTEGTVQRQVMSVNQDQAPETMRPNYRILFIDEVH